MRKALDDDCGKAEGENFMNLNEPTNTNDCAKTFATPAYFILHKDFFGLQKKAKQVNDATRIGRQYE